MLSLCSCASQKITNGISNFFKVEDGLWRGGQPNAEGWAYLHSIGVKQAIKLNPVSEGTDDLAISNGIKVVYLPISLEQQIIGKPSREQIISTVAAINTNGTYVHCLHGQDRTGLIIGAYRVEVNGWRKSFAYEEMKYYGFHPELLGLFRAWEENVP